MHGTARGVCTGDGIVRGCQGLEKHLSIPPSINQPINQSINQSIKQSMTDDNLMAAKTVPQTYHLNILPPKLSYHQIQMCVCLCVLVGGTAVSG